MESAKHMDGHGRAAIPGWLVFWTVIGLLAALQHYAYHAIDWRTGLWWGLKDWYLWGLMAMFIVRLDEWLSRRSSWTRLVTLHAVLAVLVGFVHAAIAVSLSLVVEDAGRDVGWGSAVVAHAVKKAPLNLAVYFAIVGAASLRGALRRDGRSGDGRDALRGERFGRPVARLLIRTPRGEVFVDVDRIDRIAADGNYVTIHAGGQQWLERRTLASLERLLGHARFMRIHRSHLVNLQRVDRIESGFKGRYEVLLDDGTRLPMGRTYRNALKERIGRSC